jgi:hypothetical protein
MNFLNQFLLGDCTELIPNLPNDTFRIGITSPPLPKNILLYDNVIALIGVFMIKLHNGKPLKHTIPMLILQSAIQFTQDNQRTEQVRDFKETLKPMSYLEEYCTIRVNLPRQAGLTTASLYLGPKLFSDSLYLARNFHFARNMKDIMLRLETSNQITTFDRLDGCRGKIFDGIFLDDSNYCEKEILEIKDYALTMMSASETFCLVML